MGKNTNNLIQFASWLTVERVSSVKLHVVFRLHETPRTHSYQTWAMTGTPTQQITTQTGLRNLYFLNNFVKHDFFNRQLGREKWWIELISSGWQVGNLASFYRLKHLVSYLMVRHTKSDLAEIPPPVFSRTLIRLSQSETTTVRSI